MPRDGDSCKAPDPPAPPDRQGRPLPAPDLSASGVDLSLIRWMLGLTPAERLEVLQGFVNSVWKLRHDDAP